MAKRKIRLVDNAIKPGPDLPGEIWKPIPEFLGYEASNKGRVRSIDRQIWCKNPGRWSTPGAAGWRNYRGRILSPAPTSSGYPHVQIGKGGYNYSGEDVHALVMKAFIGPCPEGYEIGHRDGDPSNACLSNLRYVTFAQNYQDQVRHGRAPRGERHYNAKLTETAVKEIRKSKSNLMALAEKYQVDRTTISDIKQRNRWKWLK